MNVTTRAEWGARYGRGDVIPGALPLVVVHHSWSPALAPDATPAQEMAAVRGIERFHVEQKGWSGIGYNWLIAPSGNAYEGRGWGRKGAHAGPGANGKSHGFVFLIDGTKTAPTPAALDTMRALIAEGIGLGHISAGYRISGHRDHMKTDCPGDLVYAMLPAMRHDYSPAIPLPPAPAPIPEPVVPVVGWPIAPPVTDPGEWRAIEIAPPVRSTPEPHPLTPLRVPEPPALSGWWRTYRWALGAARQLAAEAAPIAVAYGRARALELLDTALARLREIAARHVPALLLAVLWPRVEREARRLVETVG